MRLSQRGLGATVRRNRDLTLALAGVAALAVVLDVVGIGWGLPHPTGDWATDGLSPLGPLALAWHVLHAEKWWGKYPPFHFLLLALVQAPYVAWLRLRGEIGAIGAVYPYGLAHPLLALGRLALLARLVSVAMGVATVVFTALTAAELFGLRAAALAGLVLLSSPVTVYYAHTTNLDIPYLCWTTAGLWLAVRVVRGDAAVRTHVLLGAAAALAIATKDQAYACFALLPVPILWRRWQAGRPLDTALLAALASFAAVYALASLLAVDPSGYLGHARQLTGPANPYAGVPLSAARVVRVSLRTASATASTLGWPFALAGVAGLVLAAVRRTPGAEMPLAMGLSYYLTFMIPILYAVPRYTLPLVAALAPFAGLGLASLWGKPGARGVSARRALVGVVVAVGVARGASMDVRLLTDARYPAESWLAAHAPSGVIGTDAEPSYLPRLAPTRPVVRLTLGPDGLHYPGSGPPDLIVLTSARYRQYFWPPPRPERRVLAALLRGELCYERAAEFRSPQLFGPPLVRAVSPHIIVLRRRTEPCEAVTIQPSRRSARSAARLSDASSLAAAARSAATTSSEFVPSSPSATAAARRTPPSGSSSSERRRRDAVTRSTATAGRVDRAASRTPTSGSPSAAAATPSASVDGAPRSRMQ